MSFLREPLSFEKERGSRTLPKEINWDDIFIFYRKQQPHERSFLFPLVGLLLLL